MLSFWRVTQEITEKIYLPKPEEKVTENTSFWDNQTFPRNILILDEKIYLPNSEEKNIKRTNLTQNSHFGDFFFSIACTKLSQNAFILEGLLTVGNHFDNVLSPEILSFWRFTQEHYENVLTKSDAQTFPEVLSF